MLCCAEQPGWGERRWKETYRGTHTHCCLILLLQRGRCQLAVEGLLTQRRRYCLTSLQQGWVFRLPDRAV